MRTRLFKFIGAAAVIMAVMVLLTPALVSVAAQGQAAPKTAWGEPGGCPSSC